MRGHKATRSAIIGIYKLGIATVCALCYAESNRRKAKKGINHMKRQGESGAYYVEAIILSQCNKFFDA